MIGLSKSRILAHSQCPKQLWLQINRPELLEENQSTTALMMAGGFTEIMHPDTTYKRREYLRVELLKYCERDTWAMVRIAQFFQQGGQRAG
jgi:hypothetical protein